MDGHAERLAYYRSIAPANGVPDRFAPALAQLEVDAANGTLDVRQLDEADSYFATCPRSEEGWCLPKSASDRSGRAHEPGEPARKGELDDAADEFEREYAANLAGDVPEKVRGQVGRKRGLDPTNPLDREIILKNLGLIRPAVDAPIEPEDMPEPEFIPEEAPAAPRPAPRQEVSTSQRRALGKLNRQADFGQRRVAKLAERVIGSKSTLLNAPQWSAASAPERQAAFNSYLRKNSKNGMREALMGEAARRVAQSTNTLRHATLIALEEMRVPRAELESLRRNGQLWNGYTVPSPQGKPPVGLDWRRGLDVDDGARELASMRVADYLNPASYRLLSGGREGRFLATLRNHIVDAVSTELDDVQQLGPDYKRKLVTEHLQGPWGRMTDAQHEPYLPSYGEQVTIKRPEKFEIMGGRSEDARRTHLLGLSLTWHRTRMLVKENKVMPKRTLSVASLSKFHQALWRGWGDGEVGAQAAIQIAAAQEFGARHHLSKDDREEAVMWLTDVTSELFEPPSMAEVRESLSLRDRRLLDENTKTYLPEFGRRWQITQSLALLKSAVRARWDVTQYLHKQAGTKEMHLYLPMFVNSDKLEGIKREVVNPHGDRELTWEKYHKETQGYWMNRAKRDALAERKNIPHGDRKIWIHRRAEKLARAKFDKWTEIGKKRNEELVRRGKRPRPLTYVPEWAGEPIRGKYDRLDKPPFPKPTVASFTPDGRMANTYDDEDDMIGMSDPTRVIVRAQVSPAATLSVPALDDAYDEVRDVMVVGTPWTQFDLWEGHAPLYAEHDPNRKAPSSTLPAVIPPSDMASRVSQNLLQRVLNRKRR